MLYKVLLFITVISGVACAAIMSTGQQNKSMTARLNLTITDMSSINIHCVQTTNSLEVRIVFDLKNGRKHPPHDHFQGRVLYNFTEHRLKLELLNPSEDDNGRYSCYVNKQPFDLTWIQTEDENNITPTPADEPVTKNQNHTESENNTTTPAEEHVTMHPNHTESENNTTTPAERPNQPPVDHTVALVVGIVVAAAVFRVFVLLYFCCKNQRRQQSREQNGNPAELQGLNGDVSTSNTENGRTSTGGGDSSRPAVQNLV